MSLSMLRNYKYHGDQFVVKMKIIQAHEYIPGI